MQANLKNFSYQLQRKFFRLTKRFRLAEPNFYSIESFKQRLAIEKRRSERLNYKSSIIFFGVNNLISDNGHLNAVSIEDFVKLICSNIRCTDVVTIYQKQTILMLLPDTSNYGAQCACERLVAVILKHYSHSTELTPDDFHIKILSFPEQQIVELSEDDLLTDAPKFERLHSTQSMTRSNGLPFKNEYFNNLNVCLSTFNGSTISMPIFETFFWDQQLVSELLIGVKKSLKRLMDIVGAIIGIILFFPVMLITAALVKLESSGPVLFKQRRVGYKGKYFTFLKFRSMFVNNEDRIHQDYVTKLIHGEKDQINYGTEEKPCYKIVDDPRITPIGRFLRKTSIDELPQFFNVLKGEMSLVGPRPPIPYEVKEYQNWHFRRIMEVKPGITGLWQVSGRSRTTFDEMVRLDIEYAENWSLWLDLKILFKTVRAVIAAEGT